MCRKSMFNYHITSLVLEDDVSKAGSEPKMMWTPMPDFLTGAQPVKV